MKTEFNISKLLTRQSIEVLAAATESARKPLFLGFVVGFSPMDDARTKDEEAKAALANAINFLTEYDNLYDGTYSVPARTELGALSIDKRFAYIVGVYPKLSKDEINSMFHFNVCFEEGEMPQEVFDELFSFQYPTNPIYDGTLDKLKPVMEEVDEKMAAAVKLVAAGMKEQGKIVDFEVRKTEAGAIELRFTPVTPAERIDVQQPVLPPKSDS